MILNLFQLLLTQKRIIHLGVSNVMLAEVVSNFRRFLYRT